MALKSIKVAVLFVSDLVRSTAFNRDILGMPVKFEVVRTEILEIGQWLEKTEDQYVLTTSRTDTPIFRPRVGTVVYTRTSQPGWFRVESLLLPRL